MEIKDKTQSISEPATADKKVKYLFMVENSIYYILGVIEALLGFRFIFRLLGANPNNAFVSLIYSVSRFFLQPFQGIFSEIQGGGLETSAVFEPQTIVAMLVYAIIIWGIISLIHIGATHKQLS